MIDEPEWQNEEPVTSPKFGARCTLACIAILIIQVLLINRAGDFYRLPTMVWLSMVWSGWLISIWLAVTQPMTIVRAGLLCVAFGWHCMLMMIGRDQLVERYMILFGYYGLLQVISCVIFRIPTFTFSEQSAVFRTGKAQFSILTITLTTTGLAVVMFAVKRYRDDVLAGSAFISSTLLTMPALLLIFIVSSYASTSKIRVSLGLLSVISVSLFSASFMVAVERWLRDTQVPALGEDGWFLNLISDDTWIVYLVVLIFIGSTVYCFGKLGLEDGRQTVSTIDAEPNGVADAGE